MGKTLSYEIDAALLGHAEARINKANKKAEQRGSDARFALTTGPVRRERRPDGSVIELVAIEVVVPTINLGGWQVLGVAQMLSSGSDGHAVVTRVGDEALPEELWQVDDTCQHCGYRRKRKIVYVLARRGTDLGREFIRVGSGCLDQFVPKADLGLVRELEALLSWGEATAKKREAPLPAEARYLAIDLVAFGLVAANRDGFRREREDNKKATYELAMEGWTNRLHGKTTVDADTMQDAIEDATIIADWCMARSATEYERNLRAVFEQALLTRDELWRHDRLIVSAIRTYRYAATHGEGALARELARIESKKIRVDAARYIPLRSGHWGVVIEGARPSRGQVIEVVTKKGEARSEEIAKVIWSHPDGTSHLCALAIERAVEEVAS